MWSLLTAAAPHLPLLASLAMGGAEPAASEGSHDHLLVQCVDVAPGEKRAEYGCWVVATAHDLQFTEPAIYWHLRKFPNLPAAEAAKVRGAVVGEVEGQIWLSDFGPREMKLAGGERVATIGPLELPKAETYDAVFLYARMRPEDRSRVHTHPGPEAWYVLAGNQCLETPAGARRATAGESMTVQPNVPMELMVTGRDVRRSLALIVHDAKQPKTIVSDWKPSGACRR